MSLSEKEYVVTTFVNPHLFWLIEHGEDRNKTISDINKEYQEHENQKPNLNVYEKGQLVAVKIKGKVYRAVIEEICLQDYESTLGSTFLCWLIDFGTMVETAEVYNLPKNLRQMSCLAVQACLNNVLYVRQHLAYNDFGQPITEEQCIVTPTSRCRKCAMDLLSKTKSVKFDLETKEDGILFGDILYEDEQNNVQSLRDQLIKADVLRTQEKMFEKFKYSINEYKESKTMLIASVCKSSKNVLDNEVTDVSAACRAIANKYLDEFGVMADLDQDQEEMLAPLSFRSGRGSHASDTSSDSLETEPPKEPKKSKRDLLMQLISKQRESNKEINQESNSHNGDETVQNNSSPMSSKAFELITRAKKFLEEQHDHSFDESPEVKKPTKPNTPSKGPVFMPAGASFSLKAQKQPTQRKEFRKKPSKDGSEEGTVSSKNFPEEKVVTLSTTTAPVQTTTSSENLPTSVPQMNIKPNCSCRQCDMWTNEVDCLDNPQDKCRNAKNKVVLELMPKKNFFKENNLDRVYKIVSLDYEFMTKLHKQASAKLLVHTECLAKPVHLISEVNFHSEVHKNLMHNDFREAKRVQIYSWPALFRNQHTFLVHGPQTGKTFAYLPVICTFLLEKSERYQTAHKRGGPLAVILCSSSRKCEEVEILAKMCMGWSRFKVCVVTYPLSHINVNSTDLLITTPAIVIELLRNRIINFKRLYHLILEDGDTILKKHDAIMTQIFSLVQDVVHNRNDPKSVQLVLCARHWNVHVESVLKSLEEGSLVCIGDYLEAALYGRMRFSMKFVDSALKEQQLKDMLKDSYKIQKSVILCTNNEEIAEVKVMLMLRGIDATTVSEDMSKEEILYLEETWTGSKSGNYTVLVCTDHLLNTMLTVTGASFLIHYSLPNSWSKFVKRFGCLLENCRSPLDAKETDISHSVVLCDETCHDQMHKIFAYINTTDLKYQLPNKLKQYSQDLRQLVEEDKVRHEIGLCHILKLFGTCTNVTCSRRHVLSKDADISRHLPREGRVKFRIVEVHDVTCFALNLIQQTDCKNNSTEMDNASLDITGDLTDTLKLARRKIIHLNLGHSYVYYDQDEGDGVYYRCELLDVRDEKVRIFLSDKGIVVNTIKTRLYKLPKEFSIKKKPQAAVEAYLANMIPPYQDTEFSTKAFSKLKHLLEKNDYKSKIFVADVHLQLGCTLWLQNVHEEVALSNRIVPGFQLSMEVVRNKLVESDTAQLGRLYKLCERSEIPIPTFGDVEIKRTKKEVVKPQWAFIDADVVSEVIFSSAVSPDEIYFRQYKYSDLLYKLQKEIQETIRKPNYPTLQTVDPGTFCLAKDPDQEYSRVEVLKVEDDKALCFFVDFGDEAVVSVADLKYLPDTIIAKLPFQSILCKLHGLAPVLNEWQPEVLDTLYNFAVEPLTDIFRSLFIKVCGKGKLPDSNRNTYSVLLKDGFGGKNVLINQLLIDCGMAVPNLDAVEDFELPELSYDSDPSDEREFVREEIEENGDDYVNKEYADMEMFAEDMGKFISQFITAQKQPKKTVKPKLDWELPAITAVPDVGYCTPDVHWYQTEATVRFSIKLVDIAEYHLSLSKGRMLNFSCDKNGRQYLLKLMLYEAAGTIQHTNWGPEIRVTLTKLKKIEWPRLILSKQRTRNIHYDATKLEVVEEKRKVLELPDEVGDKDSETDDEIDMMYTVHSDLDSDLDLEMEDDSD